MCNPSTMDCDKVTFRGGAIQIVATFSISFLLFLSGLLFTWPSYTVANFVSNETVLSEPMSSAEVSLLGGLPNIGTFFLTPVIGWIMNKIGRKRTMFLTGVPFLLTWIIVFLSKSVTWILVAVAIGGCGTAGQASCAMYVSEISQDSIRGALTSSVLMIYFLGVLASYILGGYLTYSQIVYLQLSMAAINILMLSFFKDSPVYLLKIGKEKEAAESIAFYRQIKLSSKHIQTEINKIKLQLDPRLEKMIEEQTDPTVTRELLPIPETKKLSDWQFLKQSQTSIRAFVTSLVIMTTVMFMGNIPIQVFAETLFREAVPSFDANKCSVWLAVDFVAATLLCTFVMDRLGRKFLTIFTTVGSSICTLILATMVQYHWASEWIIILMIYVYNFIFNMGIAAMPYVMVGELFLPEVRGLCGSLTMAIGYGLNFIATIIFSHVVDSYSFAPLFYGVTVVGFSGATFALFYLPETKGLPVDTIQGLFLKKTKRKNEL